MSEREIDPNDRPFVEDDGLTSTESQDTFVEDTSALTHEVEMAADGSGRVVTAADRGEDAPFDPTPHEDPADGVFEDSADAGRAE